MRAGQNFTQGKILSPLLRFTVPLLLALFLQAMYGAVDLLVVGRFGTAADVSAVATGSQIMHTVTSVIVGLSAGTTVLLAQRIGQNRQQEGGKVIGSAVCLFGVLAAALTLVLVPAAGALCRVMRAPAEAFDKTVQYVQICSAGSVFIVFYNVLGSVFRGMGNSRTPLLAVMIACAANIAGDLFFVGVLGMEAAGAAIATVLAQALSVALCVAVVRRQGLPFAFGRKSLRFYKAETLQTLRLGAPVALQDLLVNISFLVITTLVNALGLVPSAGVGVAEKLCGFIMLLPGAFSQSLSAYVGQNIGAGQYARARRALGCGIASALAPSAVMAYLSFFHGDWLAGMFVKEAPVIAAAAEYLRAYAVDTLLVCFLFCFIGYFNGCGKTAFVMAQGLIGAFGVRIPVSYFMSRRQPVSLFHVGLATPSSTIVQIILCSIYFWVIYRRTAQSTRLRKA